MNKEQNVTVSDDLKMEAAIMYSNSRQSSVEPEWRVWCWWRRRRLVVALLAFFGFFNVYALRVNLSVAVVAMTEPVPTKLENGTVVYLPEFEWSSQTKGLVLSSFFYGYIVTQVLVGWLSTMIGCHRLFAIGIGTTSLLTLFTPPLAHTSTELLIAVRIVEGLFEGVTFPCIHAVWSQWAPSGERARLATFAFSGCYAGTVVSMPVCSLLAHYTGWPGIFYFFGILGLIWAIIWWLVVKESPEKDPYISPAELSYIQESRGTQFLDSAKVRHPWRAMLTSIPVWAIVAAQFSDNWGFFTLLTFLPTFMKDIFKFDITQTGFLSAVPYVAMTITLPFAGQVADWMLRRGTLSRTNIRKLFNCGSFIAQTIFTILAAYAPSVTSCVVYLTIAVGFGGFAWSGFSVNHLDIAPPHAPVLMSISNTLAALPGIISPLLTGYIVSDKTVEEWQIVFFISSAIYMLGAVIYGVFCSAEKQPWVIELQSDVTFDTDATPVTTTRDGAGYVYTAISDHKAMDGESRM